MRHRLVAPRNTLWIFTPSFAHLAEILPRRARSVRPTLRPCHDTTSTSAHSSRRERRHTPHARTLRHSARGCAQRAERERTPRHRAVPARERPSAAKAERVLRRRAGHARTHGKLRLGMHSEAEVRFRAALGRHLASSMVERTREVACTPRALSSAAGRKRRPRARARHARTGGKSGSARRLLVVDSCGAPVMRKRAQLHAGEVAVARSGRRQPGFARGGVGSAVVVADGGQICGHGDAIGDPAHSCAEKRKSAPVGGRVGRVTSMPMDLPLM